MKKVNFSISIGYLFINKNITKEFLSIFTKEILKYSAGNIKYKYSSIEVPPKRGPRSEIDHKYIGSTNDVLFMYIVFETKKIMLTDEEYHILERDFRFARKDGVYLNKIGWTRGKWDYCIKEAFSSTKKLLNINNSTRIEGIVGSSEEYPFSINDSLSIC